jgi:predicted nucleic acid-binding protein
MIVVDASALIDAFLGNEEVGAAFRRRRLHAPVTVDAEVLHGLRRGWLTGEIEEADARAVLRLLRDLPITRHSVAPFVDRMWDLRHNVTAYDAGYVVLAESLNVPLLTRDRRLARSSGHTARIEYID